MSDRRKRLERLEQECPQLSIWALVQGYVKPDELTKEELALTLGEWNKKNIDEFYQLYEQPPYDDPVDLAIRRLTST